MSYTVQILRQRPDLKAQMIRLYREEWPAVIAKGENRTAKRYSATLFQEFAEYQYMLCEGKDKVLAAGSGIPIAWDGTIEHLPAGWDEALERGSTDRDLKRTATTFAALSITIGKSHRGRGLSPEMIHAMKGIAAAHSLREVIAPVRPTTKSLYPLTPMERYVHWQQPDGLPFDPWLRVHTRVGGKILAVAPASYTVIGTVTQWEEWTGLRFPESGTYVVPDALQPIVIDCEKDEGRYVEPNVWVRHGV